jgi:myosin heavy subunit
MKIYFGEAISTNIYQRRITGAAIEVYLLEKSRVTAHIKAEQNYHIFYYFLAAMSKY